MLLGRQYRGLRAAAAKAGVLIHGMGSTRLPLAAMAISQEMCVVGFTGDNHLLFGNHI